MKPSLALPSSELIETPKVLKALVPAHRALAELKGVAKAIPNEGILISTLSMQEAQSSSAIENIITTQDALYKSELETKSVDPIAKEVSYYAKALNLGYQRVIDQEALTLNSIRAIQELLDGNTAGFRQTPDVVLRNELTNEVVYVPPSSEHVPTLMSELELFINTPNNLDPLISMALIHHQFETIHPFSDGNGRTGRIINILYLVLSDLLDTPILYLSRYINQTKPEYYRLLQSVRDTGEWEAWMLYMLEGVQLTARHTITLVQNIQELLLKLKKLIRAEHKFYSQDLINSLFKHPYTKVAFLQDELKISRATANRYLLALEDNRILRKAKLGRENFFINHELVSLLFELPAMETDKVKDKA